MGKLLKFLFGLIVVIAIVAVVGRVFFFELGKTRSYSMVPTLVPGDIFVVSTISLLGQGDIAVCENPDDSSELVALRVLGVPGDEIEFHRNHVVISGEMIQHSVEDPIFYVDRTSGEEMQYAVRIAEELVGGRLYHVALMDRAGGKEHRKTVVPEDHFFVAGDNRNLAVDSRNFGTIPIDSCVGKAVFLLWPGEDSGDLKRTDRLASKL
ncbi:MAG: signal peptidase I [Proteobacteria bacterium]|nr:signal peptidase I [Pseudomonadota bacterium]